MLRIVILLAILGLSAAASPPFKYFRPGVRRDLYSIKKVAEDSQARNLPEGSHVRYAPQDPVVVAGEYGGEIPQEEYEETTHDLDFNLEQAKSAHYTFDASIKDEINDHSHVRTETRDGQKVTGMYSYSDGFFYRTVHYVADENGYRITKQEVKRIGDGPKFNPGGRADVHGSLIGGGYSITIDDDERHPNYVDIKNTHH